MKAKPYYAVIFTSIRSGKDKEYDRMSERMFALAKEQSGFLGVESAGGEVGITVSYWESLQAIARWKQNSAHVFAQEKGKEAWYSWYKVRVSIVVREYDYTKI